MTQVPPDHALDWEDLRPVLDEAIERLPAKYRQAFVLCHLQGKTYDEAAAQLGCPKGTVATRVARARERLQRRLLARGVAVSVPALTALIADHAAASVPAALAAGTVRAAVQWLTQTATGAAVLSTPAAALTEGMLRTMFLTRIKTVTLVLVAVGAIATGTTAGIVHLQNTAAAGARGNEHAGGRDVVAVNVPGDKPAATKPAIFVPFKKYNSGDHEFEAGFVPNKTEIVLGEPIRATFTLKNLSAKQFDFWFGGDYRGTGRHNRFKISAVDSAGAVLTDPKVGPNGMILEMGGMMQLLALKPKATETKPLVLTDFRTFERPGQYTITCRFGVPSGSMSPHMEKLAFTVETTYRLTILPRSAENVARAQRAYVEQALRERGSALADTIAVLTSFAGELAVPDLLKLAAAGDQELRAAALRGLGQFTTEPAVTAALKALRDPDDTIRSAAAEALGAMKTEATIAALAQRWPLEKPDVAAVMLIHLGRTKSPQALPELQLALSRPDPKLYQAAVAGLVDYGGEPAAALLRGFVLDTDLDRREAVVKALIEGLRQPFQLEWVLPLIHAGKDYPKGRNPNEAMRLLRMYGGDQAASELARLLDFDDSSPKSSRNFWILYHLEAAPKAPKVKWIHDPNRAGTPQEIGENRMMLTRVRQWLAEQDRRKKDGEGK